MGRFSVVALVSFAVSACVSPLSNLRHERHLEHVPVVVRWSDADAEEAQRLAESVLKARERLEQWGGLQRTVTLHVVPSHEALTRAVGRDFDWLRAWALDDTIVLQSPRTWPGGRRSADVDELLLHELTHCTLFQQVGPGEEWKTKRIPLWFREGMATVTANQGALFPSLETLARWQAANPTADVFGNGEQLSATAYAEVYGMAHQGVTFLRLRYGETVVRDIIIALRSSPTFAHAFVERVGVPVDVFANDFRSYLRLRGFRGWGRPIQRVPNRPRP